MLPFACVYPGDQDRTRRVACASSLWMAGLGRDDESSGLDNIAGGERRQEDRGLLRSSTFQLLS